MPHIQLTHLDEMYDDEGEEEREGGMIVEEVEVESEGRRGLIARSMTWTSSV